MKFKVGDKVVLNQEGRAIYAGASPDNWESVYCVQIYLKENTGTRTFRAVVTFRNGMKIQPVLMVDCFEKAEDEVDELFDKLKQEVEDEV